MLMNGLQLLDRHMMAYLGRMVVARPGKNAARARPGAAGEPPGSRRGGWTHESRGVRWERGLAHAPERRPADRADSWRLPDRSANVSAVREAAARPRCRGSCGFPRLDAGLAHRRAARLSRNHDAIGAGAGGRFSAFRRGFGRGAAPGRWPLRRRLDRAAAHRPGTVPGTVSSRAI